MEIKPKPRFDLLVSDIDNTLFDWVAYYVPAIAALLETVESKIGVDYETLAQEALTVFARHKSIEYPFLVQELPSVMAHYGSDIDVMLEDLVKPARERFLEIGEPLLRPYDGVVEALAAIKIRNPELVLVALTDAPRYVGMWKLNKLNILKYFDAVYGLQDPVIPTDPGLGRVKVDPQILLKHLQKSNFGFSGRIRVLPEDYEKPGTRGLKTVLMDYGMDETVEHRRRVLWVGDNLRKDVGLGQAIGVCTAWAAYGCDLDPRLLSRLHQFSPPDNIQKNVSLAYDDPETPKPDRTLRAFSELVDFL